MNLKNPMEEGRKFVFRLSDSVSLSPPLDFLPAQIRINNKPQKRGANTNVGNPKGRKTWTAIDMVVCLQVARTDALWGGVFVYVTYSFGGRDDLTPSTPSLHAGKRK